MAPLTAQSSKLTIGHCVLPGALLEATAKKLVRNELSLKTKLDVIRDSNGKSHRQLAERYNISRSQVGNVLRNKRKYLDAFENNKPASKKRQSINTIFDEVGVICITNFDIDFAWTITNSNKYLA